MKKTQSIMAANKSATFNYEILDQFEAGIVLSGTEIKSVRNGGLSLKESYCAFDSKLELYLTGAHIAPYEHGNRSNHLPTAPRKLLLHRQELHRLYGRSQEKGLSIIPLRAYLKNGYLKLALGLGRGKKLHDKRQSIKERSVKRQLQRGNYDSL